MWVYPESVPEQDLPKGQIDQAAIDPYYQRMAYPWLQPPDCGCQRCVRERALFQYDNNSPSMARKGSLDSYSVCFRLELHIPAFHDFKYFTTVESSKRIIQRTKRRPFNTNKSSIVDWAHVFREQLARDTGRGQRRKNT